MEYLIILKVIFLKKCIRKKIKDKDFLMILDEIIDSTDNVRDISSKLTNKIGIGLPIGNYLSHLC